MNTQSLKYNNNTLVSLIILEQARHCNVAHPCCPTCTFLFYFRLGPDLWSIISHSMMQEYEKPKNPKMWDLNPWETVLNDNFKQLSTGEIHVFDVYFTYIIHVKYKFLYISCFVLLFLWSTKCLFAFCFQCPMCPISILPVPFVIKLDLSSGIWTFLSC